MLLSGCQPPTPINHSLGELAKGDIRYVDHNGNPVNIGALQSKIGQNYSTLSFRFAACGDVCPITALELSKVSKKYPSIKHVMISTDPAQDFKNGTLKKIIEAQGLVVDGPLSNTMILFPTTDGKEPTLANSAYSPQIQENFELILKSKNLTDHSGAVILFNPQGKAVAAEARSTEIAKTLSTYLQQQPAQQVR